MILLNDLNRQYLRQKKEIDITIKNTIKNSDFINGKNVNKFAKNFSKKLGMKYCITVGNGTDALMIAIKSLKLKKDDEIITTCNGWISTAEAIIANNCKPVFVDQDETFTMNVKDLIKKITKKTKLILPVHLYGNPSDMGKIKKICKIKKIFLIEDCAQAHFAKIGKKNVGTFGDISTFSFFPGKPMGCFGDGGAICTNSREKFIFMKSYANHGGMAKHQHNVYGINSRLDNLQAGILNIKLKKISNWNNKRIKIAKIYNKELSKVLNVKLPFVKKNFKSVYNNYVIRVPSKYRLNLINYLIKNNIQTNVHYPKPISDLKIYRKFIPNKIKFNFTDKYKNEILSIPMHPFLKLSEIKKICGLINKFLKNKI